MLAVIGEELKRVLNYNRNIAVIVGFFVFMSFIPAVILKESMKHMPAGVNLTQAEMLKAFIRMYFFTYTVSLAVFLVQSISMDVFIADKKEKALDVLLAGPISIRELLMAKTLALFSIVYPIALLATLIFIIAANLFVAGRISYLPDYLMWIYLFTVLPVLSLSVTGISGAWQMVSKRFSAANFFLFLIAFIVMGIPSFLVSRMANVDTVAFMWIYGPITLSLVVILMLVMRFFLNKERIVLN